MKRAVMSILNFALLVALLSMPTFALAQEPEPTAVTGASPKLVVRKRVSPAQQKAALAFWTRAAMAAPPGTSAVYTSYTVNKAVALHKIYPHVWVGRLSFSTPGGTSFCSGT